jgi:hypothetical protein
LLGGCWAHQGVPGLIWGTQAVGCGHRGPQMRRCASAPRSNAREAHSQVACWVRAPGPDRSCTHEASPVLAGGLGWGCRCTWRQHRGSLLKGRVCKVTACGAWLWGWHRAGACFVARAAAAVVTRVSLRLGTAPSCADDLLKRAEGLRKLAQLPSLLPSLWRWGGTELAPTWTIVQRASYPVA